MKTMNSYLSNKLIVAPNHEKGGFSILANLNIDKNELLIIWSGIVIDKNTIFSLSEKKRQRAIQIEDDFYLVSSTENDPADFINHSCNPNAGISGQVSLIAMRDIESGEEICYDYAMSDGSHYDIFTCHCGHTNCRKVITGDDWKTPELWQKYDNYFSYYLKRRIDKLNHK